MNSSPLPGYLRWAGPILAPGYGLGVRLHRALSTPVKAPLPAVCVGNITVGGTGKTPACKYFARGLAARGRRPAVLMRGYKNQAVDEAEEINLALADLNLPSPVIVNSDRIAGAAQAKERGCDCVVLDDGFQHWRLARDLDIVLIDATDPFGGGQLLPYGRLREPVAGLARAGALIVTRADALNAAELDALRAELATLAPQAFIATARHSIGSLRSLSGAAPESLQGHAVVAACGIGNPSAFQRTLLEQKARVSEFVQFSDHHDYTQSDLDGLSAKVAAKQSQAKLVTEKDSPKIAKLALGSLPVWVLSVTFTILEGETELWRRVDAALK